MNETIRVRPWKSSEAVSRLSAGGVEDPALTLAACSEESDPHPARDRVILGNVGLAFVANAAYALATWAVVIYLARVAPAESVGTFAYAFALAAPVMMFADMKLRTILVTDFRSEHNSAEVMALRVLTATAGVVVVAAAAAWVKPAALWVVFWVAVAKAFDLVSDLYYGIQQKAERLRRVTISRCAQGTLQFGAFVVGYRLTSSLAWASFGLALASAAMTLSYDRRAARAVAKGAPPSALAGLHGRLGRLVRLALPLALAEALGSLNGNVSRYVIDAVLGTATLGRFAATAYLLTAGATVIAALGYAATPRLARYFAAGRLFEFRRLTTFLVGAGLALGVLGTLAAAAVGEPLLRVVYGSPYAESAPLLVALLAASTIQFAMVFFGTAVVAARRFTVQAPINLAACLTTALVALAGALRFGTFGVVAGIAAGAGVQGLLYLRYFGRLAPAEAA